MNESTSRRCCPRCRALRTNERSAPCGRTTTNLHEWRAVCGCAAPRGCCCVCWCACPPREHLPIQCACIALRRPGAVAGGSSEQHLWGVHVCGCRVVPSGSYSLSPDWGDNGLDLYIASGRSVVIRSSAAEAEGHGRCWWGYTWLCTMVRCTRRTWSLLVDRCSLAAAR